MRHSHANVLWRLCMIIRQYMFVHHCLEILIKNAALTHKSTFQVGHAPFVPGCRMLSFARKLISYAKQVSWLTDHRSTFLLICCGHTMDLLCFTPWLQWPDRPGISPEFPLSPKDGSSFDALWMLIWNLYTTILYTIGRYLSRKNRKKKRNQTKSRVHRMRYEEKKW